MAIDKEVLKELFEYSDGRLIYKPRNCPKFNKRWVGFTPSKPKTNGYLYVSVNGKRLLVHRVIYAMHYGYWPKYVDHIDGNPLNNKIQNLRSVDAKLNTKNSKKRVDNTSGCTGVYQLPYGAWRVRLGSNHIGVYESLELAELVYHEVKLNEGYTARHGV